LNSCNSRSSEPKSNKSVWWRWKIYTKNK